MKLWEDPRVARGMQTQLELRRQRLEGGDKPLGWKVGFGAPAMLKRLDITGTAGRIPDAECARSIRRQRIARRLVEAGGRARNRRPYRPRRSRRRRPRHRRRRRSPASRPRSSWSISHTPPEDPERILGGNIYQRHVVLDGDRPGARRRRSATV